MDKDSILAALLQDWRLALGLTIVMAIILALPYEVTHATRSGRAYREWRALLWSYQRGPHRWCLRLDGLLRLQRLLVGLLRWLWLQGRAGLRAALKALAEHWLA